MRRLVSTHPTIRIVLMSATLCADLYREYFDLDEGHIFVGARRFPITECFADDIARTLRLGPKLTDVAKKVVSLTSAGKQPSSNLAKLQYDLAVAISLAVGQIGSSVLIFVPGTCGFCLCFDESGS